VASSVGSAATTLLLFAAVLTKSRGGLLSLPIIALAELAHARKRRLPGVGLLLAIAVLVAVTPSSVWQRFRDIRVEGQTKNSDQGSAEIRFDVLVAGMRMIEAHPLAGIGLGRFKQESADYNPALHVFGAGYVSHNTYLGIGAECGLPALALFLALMAVGFSNCRAVSRFGTNLRLAPIARAMRLSLLVYAIVSIFLTAWYLVGFWLMVFLSQNLLELAICSEAAAATPVIIGRASADTGVRAKALQASVDIAKETA
jgi:O-antigen ligase